MLNDKYGIAFIFSNDLKKVLLVDKRYNFCSGRLNGFIYCMEDSVRSLEGRMYNTLLEQAGILPSDIGELTWVDVAYSEDAEVNICFAVLSERGAPSKIDKQYMHWVFLQDIFEEAVVGLSDFVNIPCLLAEAVDMAKAKTRTRQFAM